VFLYTVLYVTYGKQIRTFYEILLKELLYSLRRKYVIVAVIKKMEKEKPFKTKMIADGRITIPKDLREKHKLVEGDLLELQLIRKVE
jgi:ATP:corrinoid adenosyltransferase